MFRFAAAHPLELYFPARAAEAGDAERRAGRGEDAPAGEGGTAFAQRVDRRGAAEHEGGHARALGGELEALGRCGRQLRHFADHAGETGMAQAFLHRQQHMGVAARLDMDDAVRREPGEIERGREQVAPSQAPEHRALEPGEDAGEEHRRGGVVA